MRSDYSEKEIRMIAAISGDYARLADNDSLMPVQLLQMLGMKCFVDGATGPAVDSLRRCLKAMRDCKPYRDTQEYEALITLD